MTIFNLRILNSVYLLVPGKVLTGGEGGAGGTAGRVPHTRLVNDSRESQGRTRARHPDLTGTAPENGGE